MLQAAGQSLARLESLVGRGGVVDSDCQKGRVAGAQFTFITTNVRSSVLGGVLDPPAQSLRDAGRDLGRGQVNHSAQKVLQPLLAELLLG